jgi:hypothetical protein
MSEILLVIFGLIAGIVIYGALIVAFNSQYRKILLRIVKKGKKSL